MSIMLKEDGSGVLDVICATNVPEYVLEMVFPFGVVGPPKNC
jgi:hypothetical protein